MVDEYIQQSLSLPVAVVGSERKPRGVDLTIYGGCQTACLCGKTVKVG